MITSLEINNLRGIREGRLDGLAPLTVLTGTNASGKSTVLDALLIATSPRPDEAVGQAVRRHAATLAGSRWLFNRPQDPARLEATDNDGKRWSRQLERYDHCSSELRDELHEWSRRCENEARAPYTMVHLREDQYADDAQSAWIGFSLDNVYRGDSGRGKGLSTQRFVRLVDPGVFLPLDETFSDVVRAGRIGHVDALLADLIPGYRQLQLLTEAGAVVLHLTTATSTVPVGLAGDGVQAFVQLALETAAAPGGLVLIEEPEVYQHPSALRQTARALVANVRRGVQVVLTTHSLELIDALLAESEKDDLAKMEVLNLALEDGVLRAGRRQGEEIAFARRTLENDLR